MKPKNHSFLESCASGGCGAKIAPGILSGLLKDLPRYEDPRLLVGFDSMDDAAVYRIDSRMSAVSTVDFFPPVVDDPFLFGKIAAANALSDVYAMGAKPAMALNLVCFPEDMDPGRLRQMLEGGAEKVAEAEAALSGGHSIYSREIKYGLAVTGFAETEGIIRNNTPLVTHRLILTKPLGTGIILAAMRAGEAAPEALKKAVSSMERLNRYAAEKMKNYRISACTDITGFGLLGHLLELAGTEVSVEIFPGRVPYFPEAFEYAGRFLLTAAGQRNRIYLGEAVSVDALPFALQEIMLDPQTSGGLLICVEKERAEALLEEIRKDDPAAEIIGRIIERQARPVVFE